MEFCEKLLLMRRARGMTQTDMADLLGVTRQSVYKWEKGESYPEAMTLLAMREVFGLSLDALLDPTYIVRMAGDASPVVTHIGEEIPAATDIEVLRVPQDGPKSEVGMQREASEQLLYTADAVNDAACTTENGEDQKKTDVDSSDDDAANGRRRKRGLLSRIFG